MVPTLNVFQTKSIQALAVMLPFLIQLIATLSSCQPHANLMQTLCQPHANLGHVNVSMSKNVLLALKQVRLDPIKNQSTNTVLLN